MYIGDILADRDVQSPWTSQKTDDIQYLRTRKVLTPRTPNYMSPLRGEDLGNVDVSLKMSNLSNIDEIKHTVDVEFECITQWVPALPEFRIPYLNKVLTLNLL